MGRLNPHRRLLKAQAAALAAVRMEHSAAHGVEMSMLQQGVVRSHMAWGNPTSMTFREPSWTNPDARGKAKRPKPQRFAQR